MGVRNATVRRFGVPDLTTTVLTMTLTGLAVDSRLAGGSGKGTARRAAAALAMLLGAIAGALLLKTSLAPPLFTAAALALVVGAAYLPWRGEEHDGGGGGYRACVLGLPTDIEACLFDLDGVLTQTAKLHAAAWKEAFDGYLRERAAKRGEEFVPFDPVEDYDNYVDGRPRYDGVRSFLASRGIELPAGRAQRSPERRERRRARQPQERDLPATDRTSAASSPTRARSASSKPRATPVCGARSSPRAGTAADVLAAAQASSSSSKRSWTVWWPSASI